MVKINLSLLHDTVQAVEGKLDHPFISRKKARQLSHKLDKVFSDLFIAGQESPSPFVQAALGEMEKKIQHLYREIEEAWMTRQVSQIQQETHVLKQAMKTGDAPFQAADELKKKIDELLVDYRPSLEERRVIAEAYRVVESVKSKALQVLFCEWVPPPARSIDEDLVAGEFEEILDVAYALYEGDLSDAKRRFNQLPKVHQERVHAHMVSLGGSLFSDYLKSQQALFATTNELVGNGELYPSEDLIEDIFHELKILHEHEKSQEETSLLPA